MDPTDRALILALQRNARVAFRDLAAEVNSRPALRAVRRRALSRPSGSTVRRSFATLSVRAAPSLSRSTLNPRRRRRRQSPSTR